MPGFSPSKLLLEVRTRLNGDTDSGGLRAASNPLATAVYTRRFPVPGATDFPYLICYFDAINNEDTLSDEQKRMGITVEWFVSDAVSGLDATERSNLILERLLGDWHEHEDKEPDYGLQRWTPTLTDDWLSGPMMFEDAAYEPDGLGVVRWSARFGVFVNKLR